MAGEKITDRLVSFADPEARPIRKGKLGTPTEFGYVVQIAELCESTSSGARGLILPTPSPDRVAQRVRPAPADPAADRRARPQAARSHARRRVRSQGRISHLKRRYGLDRSRLKGDAGQQIWTAWAILAYDLDTLAVRSR